jgi:hypothetical protein
MISEEEMYIVTRALYASHHCDQNESGMRLMAIWTQIQLEHSAMREALRWRLQSAEPAPSDDVLFICEPGHSPVTCMGRHVRAHEYWLPIPPLDKEE